MANRPNSNSSRLKIPTYPTVSLQRMLLRFIFLPLGIEGVAHTSDGAYVGGFPVAVQLFAKVGYVKVDHVAVDVIVAAPDRVEQYGAGEDLFRALNEGCEQRKLLGAQIHPLFTAPHGVASGIEAYVSCSKDRVGLLSLPRPPRES